MIPVCRNARRWWWIVLLVAGCESESEFRAQLASYQVEVRSDMTRSRGCADDLRAVLAQDPLAATRALEEVPRSFVNGAWALPERSRNEIARREHEIAAASEIINRAIVDGPAALHRVVTAAANAHRVGQRLCQARDVASTLAAMDRGAPGEAERVIATGGGASAEGVLRELRTRQ